MSQTMRAVDIKDGAGPPSSLFLNDQIPRPTPKPTECLIRIKSFGLNRADTLQRDGKYPVPAGVTKTMGLEFAGVIEEVGSGTDDSSTWERGQEVLGLTYGGAYAEFVTVDKGMLIHKPKELGWEVCGGLCEVWMTALQALYLVGEFDPEGKNGVAGKKTKSVLWHAGASAVSIAGIQLVKAAAPDVKVFVTTRQNSKIEWCKEKLGAAGGANTKENPDGWAKSIEEQNEGNGVDLIIDFIGAPVFGQNLEVCALDGRIVQLGSMGGTVLPDKTNLGMILMKRIRFTGSTLRSRDPAYQRRLRDLFVEQALPGLIKGSFENHVDTVMSWTKIREAHEYMESNQSKGKIVCVVD